MNYTKEEIEQAINNMSLNQATRRKIALEDLNPETRATFEKLWIDNQARIEELKEMLKEY